MIFNMNIICTLDITQLHILAQIIIIIGDVCLYEKKPRTVYTICYIKLLIGIISNMTI